MNLNAFLLILISVFFHAGWNFISKANRPSSAFYFLANLTVALFLIPVLFFARIPWLELDWKFWAYFCGSVFFEVIYFTGLFRAYRRHDISIAYPMVRALPVIMVALITLVFGIGSVPRWNAWLGFLIVAGGCVVLPQKNLQNFDWRSFIRSVTGPILLAAAGTTGYTVMDKLATAQLLAVSGSGRIVTLCAYLAAVEIFIAVGLLGCILNSSRETVELFRKSWKTPYPYLCGIFSGLAYLLVLAAMGMVTNVSFLQAFRQMSLPLGVAAGVILLHEKLTWARVIGTLLIVFGLILTVF